MIRRALLLSLVLLAAATPAVAQPFAADSDQPIEITADVLEVVQADRLATFSGNVDAVQGELVLSADELLVHYRSNSDEAEAATSTGAIRRIEARGSVVVTSPRETAEGETGVYDVADALVTLEGSVILTREDNVIRGDRLELDLETGVSRVIAAPGTGESADPNRRVRAVFVPSDDPDASSGAGESGQTSDESSRGQDGASRSQGGGDVGQKPPVPRVKPAAAESGG